MHEPVRCGAHPEKLARRAALLKDQLAQVEVLCMGETSGRGWGEKPHGRRGDGRARARTIAVPRDGLRPLLRALLCLCGMVLVVVGFYVTSPYRTLPYLTFHDETLLYITVHNLHAIFFAVRAPELARAQFPSGGRQERGARLS